MNIVQERAGVAKVAVIVVMALTLALCLTGCTLQRPREARPLTNPNALNAIVWAKKVTGTYYCGDSVMFGKDHGSYIKQAKALDSGYQPEFGAYCAGSETPSTARPRADRSRVVWHGTG